MLDIFLRIPAYITFRYCRLPRILPLNFTFNITYHCNSRCLTCNIWKKHNTDELTLDNWTKIFSSLGTAPYWTTITGGEPFLRNDMVDIVRILYDKCHPRIINLPTNGLLPDIVIPKVDEICRYCKSARIIVNVSIDGIDDMYDYIRGVKDGFQYVKKTYQSLKTMKYTNLTVGIGTVVSKFNVQYLAQIYEYVMHTLKPDSYVTEIAEQRHELDTLDADISPEVDEYHQVVDYLCTQLIQEKFHGISRLIRAFRLEYYQMTAKMLRIQRQIIPCYGGFNSCLITPDGNVWPCCVRENSMGSLKDTGYDFRKLWSGKQAEDVRKAIKTDRCFCPLANVAYTNMLCYPLSWWRICMNIFKTF